MWIKNGYTTYILCDISLVLGAAYARCAYGLPEPCHDTALHWMGVAMPAAYATSEAFHGTPLAIGLRPIRSPDAAICDTRRLSLQYTRSEFEHHSHEIRSGDRKNRVDQQGRG